MGTFRKWFIGDKVSDGRWFIPLFTLFVLYLFIISFDNVFGRLGFETKTGLKVKLAEQTLVLEEIKAQTLELQKDLEYEKTMAEALRVNMVEFHKNEQIIETLLKESDRHVEAEIVYIKSDPTLTQPQRNKAIAKVEIDSLWSIYCSVEHCE